MAMLPRHAIRTVTGTTSSGTRPRAGEWTVRLLSEPRSIRPLRRALDIAKAINGASGTATNDALTVGNNDCRLGVLVRVRSKWVRHPDGGG